MRKRSAPADSSAFLLERVRPSARCYKCGDGVVDAVCCHCGRLLCETHMFSAGPVRLRTILEVFRAGTSATSETLTVNRETPQGTDEKHADADLPDQQDKPDSAGSEFTAGSDYGDLLGEGPRGSAHRNYCGNCAPKVRPFDAELIGATTTTGLGAAILPAQTVVGAVLLCIGIGRIAVRAAIGMRQRAQQARDHGADLILNPNLRRIKIRERIEGSVHLHQNSRYEATVGGVAGSVVIEGNWSRAHRAAVERYRRRTRSVPVNLAAGHLVLHGPGHVAFRPTTDAISSSGPALILEPRVADQPLLSSASGLGETQWHPEYAYAISHPEGGWRLPLWISPTIAANLDRHVLELHVQWSTRGPERDRAGVPLRLIELLEIAVPAHWGSVEFMTKLDGEVYSGQPEPAEDDGPARRTLSWKKMPFKQQSDQGSVRLVVRFSERIDLEAELTGRIEAEFTGAMSGLTRAAVYRTDGGPVNRLDGSVSPATIAEITFTLSLAGLRYQDQRAVPDRARVEDGQRRENEAFPGVVPNHRTVAILTNALADEGYAIIRLQENPAQSSPRPGVVHRLWDIAGRYYEGVYPIEFHLQLSGEETHKGQQVSGDTVVGLTVHGSFANAKMELRVVEEWNRLWKRIRLSLEGAGSGPRPIDQPLDAASAELVRLRNAALTEVSRLRAAAESGGLDAETAAEMVVRITRDFGLGEG